MITHRLTPEKAAVLAPMRSKPRWQLLHIRSTGLKLERPAQLSSTTHRPLTTPPVEEFNVDLEEEEKYFSEFGSSIDPDFVYTLIGQKALAAMPSAPPDLLSFAKWAFGPMGLPDLQVLAYDDFSHKGRYKWQNWLFCRSEFAHELAKHGHSLGFRARIERDLTFREVTGRDWRERELISDCSEMLEACPEDTILHDYYLL